MMCFALLNYQCESDEGMERTTLAGDSSDALEQTVTVDNAGEIHNEMVIDYLLHIKDSSKNSRSYSDEDGMIAYFEKKYGVALENSDYYLYNQLRHIEGETYSEARTTADLSERFDPYVVLESLKDRMTPYMYEKFRLLLTHTEKDGEDPRYVATVIQNFKEGVAKDSNLSKTEMQDFLVVLDVYQSSLALWTYVNEQNSSYGTRTQCIGRGNAWKIPAADFVQGTLGGLIGGPAGALAGLAGGSITMAIGLSGGCSGAVNPDILKRGLSLNDPQPYKGRNIDFYNF